MFSFYLFVFVFVFVSVNIFVFVSVLVLDGQEQIGHIVKQAKLGFPSLLSPVVFGVPLPSHRDEVYLL